MKLLKNRETLKKSCIFTLSLLPFALAGIYLTLLETIKTYSPEQTEAIIKQVGNEKTLILLGMIQTSFYFIACSFLGYLISAKIGLMKPFQFEPKAAVQAVVPGIIMGVLTILDYFLFTGAIPQLAEYYETQPEITAATFIYSILYGGIVEEILLRLFTMSLLVLIIKSVFFRKEENYSPKIFIISNIISAALFAAGHLPYTAVLFGSLTPMIVFRCFLLNGTVGLFFGYLYRKYGIGYAMLAHGLCHVFMKCVLLVLL